MKRLSIFVSGNGTNLQRIADYFANNLEVKIVNVVFVIKPRECVTVYVFQIF